MRQRSFRVIVVLPAFNEEANIGPLLERIDEHLNDDSITYQVIIVDDGSVDGTAEIVAKYASYLPIIIKTHQRNQGLGTTIRDGLAHANEIAGNNDIIVTMDADESHTPGLILRMVRMIREGHDVVIASRYQRGSAVYGLAAHRRLISWSASWLFRLLFPTRGLRDYTCGYRAYRSSVLRSAIGRYGGQFIDQDGFQCMVDLVLKLRRMGLIFGEVPMVLRYDLKKGESKMRLLRTARNTLRLVVLRRCGI